MFLIIAIASFFLFLPNIRSFIISAVQILLKKELNIYFWNFRIKQFAFFLAGISLISFAIFYNALDTSGEVSNRSAQINYTASSINDFTNSKIFCFFVISSVAVLLVCSTCSPLYAFHTWDDSNCFMTVGKNVLNGKIIYRDLYEQKGAVLYFIHTIASLVSKKSFLCIWLYEILSLSFFCLFSYKILKLFVAERICLFIPVLMAVLFSSKNFVQGDSAEEFCLLFLIIPFYFSIKNIQTESLFSKKELFITGLCAGTVLWIKYTLCGFFFGWAIVPVAWYIKQKKIKEIIESVIFIFGGVIAISLLPLSYFAINGAIKDCVQVYFIDNIKNYAAQTNMLEKLMFVVTAFIKYAKQNPRAFAFLVLSLVAGKKYLSKINFINFILCFLATLFFVFIGGREHEYYSLILSVFTIFSLIPIYKFSEHIILRNFKYKNTIIYAISVAFCFITSVGFFSYFHISKYKQSDLPQYKFAKIINASNDKSLLQYEILDNGLYTVADVVPQTKYFCRLNINNEEMIETQKYFVENAITEFVFTKDHVILEKYELIAAEQIFLRKNESFFLYQRK